MGYFGIAILSVVLRNTATGQNYEYLWGCEHNDYSFIIRTQIQEHLIFSCIFCESKLLYFLPEHKGSDKGSAHNLRLKESHLLRTCIPATFSLMFSNRNNLMCSSVMSKIPLFLFIKVLACFAQFSQIEQWNIMLMFSRNDGKSRQEITIFIQYLGFNLG